MTRTNKNYCCYGWRDLRHNEYLGRTVGDVHNLMRWLEIAFPGKSESFLFDYFKDFSNAQVVVYLKDNKGIRLEAI